jgi:hypothetical protein
VSNVGNDKGYKQLVLIEAKPAEAGFVGVAAPFYGDSGSLGKQ